MQLIKIRNLPKKDKFKENDLSQCTIVIFVGLHLGTEYVIFVTRPAALIA